MKTATPSQSFSAKRKVIRMWTVMIPVAAVLVLPSLFGVGGPSVAWLLLAISILMSIWMRRASLVRLYQDHFEMKFAPLAPLRKLHYQDVTQLEVVSSKKARLFYQDGAKERTVAIPLNLLEAEDGLRLVKFLDTKARKAA